MDWDAWLTEFESNLQKLGYRKFNQNHKSEDFCYWKSFFRGRRKLYMVGVLFYDFRKYVVHDSGANNISIMYQCTMIVDNRIDMEVSKNIDVPEFEVMAKTFYQAMSVFNGKT